jgi:four helix bundle protein
VLEGTHAMFEYNFEKLEIWKLSLRLVKEIHQLIKKLPAEENYALGDQMRRAALSISLNIAEGWGKSTKKDFARYISIAVGSTLEVAASLRVIDSLHYMEANDMTSTDELTKELYFKLLKFSDYLKKNQ